MGLQVVAPGPGLTLMVTARGSLWADSLTFKLPAPRPGRARSVSVTVLNAGGPSRTDTVPGLDSASPRPAGPGPGQHRWRPGQPRPGGHSVPGRDPAITIVRSVPVRALSQRSRRDHPIRPGPDSSVEWPTMMIDSDSDSESRLACHGPSPWQCQCHGEPELPPGRNHAESDSDSIGHILPGPPALGLAT